MATTVPWDQVEVTHVHQAYSGPQALEILSRHDIHILITDIRMPGMSGLELIEQARTRWPQLDCILLTGHAEFQYAKRAVELQAVNYLVKPIKDEELLHSICNITDKQKQRWHEQAEIERAKQAVHTQLPQLKADLLMARANAEVSVSEERNRIAHDIHDIVGHTLTTTLVQMEAAKRLILRNETEGLNRLEQSQQLVRKSLQDIREAVRLMKRPLEDVDLESELRQFVREAEETAEITINCIIDLPTEISDALVKKVVYHALQEGITNGIRHGHAVCFLFLLYIKNGELRFSLWNDGIPYNGSAMGFGLRSMNKRIRQLGGHVSLAASSDLEGTLLTLSIPL